MSTEMIPTPSDQVPVFLQDGSAEQSLSLLTQFSQPPRMKIRQPTARPPLSDLAPEGAVVLMPSQQILAMKDEEFNIIPVFFYPEWCVFNPLSMPDLPTIRERSLDPQSEIARLSRNPETRLQPMPDYEKDFNHADPKKVKRLSYREHLNFIFQLQGGELNGVQFVATFAKGEHKTGRTLASSIQMRVKSTRAPSYGLVFTAKSSRRENKDGIWYGLNITLPTDGTSPFVQDEEQFKLLKQSHEELLKAYTDNKLGDFIKPEEDSDTEPSAESAEF